MPVIKQAISHSQLAELLGVDPARFIAVEQPMEKDASGWRIVLEPEDSMQTSGTMPQLNTGKKKGGKKGPGGRAC